jgi:hypothetical protein
MENRKCLPGSTHWKTARLHAAFGMLNAGMLQNVREPIIKIATKCIEVQEDYLNMSCKYKLSNLIHDQLASMTEKVFIY